MKLNQPYYIEKRNGASHIDLNGTWAFFYADCETETWDANDFQYFATLPKSIYHCVCEAGILPDPYAGTNSKLYHWVDEKVWYFKKTFSLAMDETDCDAYLCFDGVSYYCRVWVNGNEIGDHEGMFGGPVCNIAPYLHHNGENEIIVEVKGCNYGIKEQFDPWNPKGENTQIVPWNIARDTETSNGDFIVLGIWNTIRLEIVNKLHISRPYLYTQSIEDDCATLHLEMELTDGSIEELRPYYGKDDGCYEYTRAYDTGITGASVDRGVKVAINIYDKDACVYHAEEDVPLMDYEHLGMDKRYYELQFYQKQISIPSPKLWYPNGLGEPFLYTIEISLSANGKEVDHHAFPFGIRTFDATNTKGNKYRKQWGKFLFRMNGGEIFLKGMNWMPIDFLFGISPDRYEWCLSLVKNAGIQLLRVWNGGGMPETDTFYELCDKMGILVWQDLMIANTTSVQHYPQELLESQIAYNLYRTRNHPSLVLLCGGNEFNPYTCGNAAAMFVTERTVQTLTPDRIFHYTTADKGSAHIYIDMEPVWYRHRYKQLPFLAESGIHSFPNYVTLEKLIDETECTSVLCNLSSPEFAEKFPELLNHFTEYRPDRIPRMLSRISQITDVSNISLHEICEASQVQAYEFYQLMIQSMRENYPVCGGVMPWVFKRAWATVGIQTVDGDDRPGYAYYAVKNSYQPVNVCWCQEWSVLSVDETISLKVKVFNENNEDLSGAQINLTVYRPDLTVYANYTSEVCDECDFGNMTLDKDFCNTCFLVCADLCRDGMLISRSVYFNKCTELLSDRTTYQTYRTAPGENMYFEHGPWLKDSLTHAKSAILNASIVQKGQNGRYGFADVCINNQSDVPAYPVTLELPNTEQRFFCDDNFFLLKPGEEKIVRMFCNKGTIENVTITMWNGESVHI